MASYEHSEERHRFSGPHGSDVARVSIDEALSNNWLDVWYQPKIDLRRKCLAGAEALVRMHHPQAGLLWPENYLSALDEESLLKLSEYSLVTSMRHWTVFAEAGGFGSQSMCRRVFFRRFRSARSLRRIVRSQRNGPA